MQSQRVQQRAITANQSLQVVQTLLRAGFGCVAYLRGLLPDENFTEAHLTSSGNPSLSQPESQENDAVFEKRRPPTNSVRLKTIKKGWSTEGDKLLEYLEEGIFDALEKQYLRSFIFAVYLDDKDPENIIEAYTFNFSYHTVPGSSSKVPIMTLGEKMNKMSLNTRSTSKMDPAAEAIVKGKPPTLGDVKQSVKNLVRSLIAAIQTLNGLPKRRFATFKLFYMDHVPEHYEPPHFTAGNPDNRYFFTTHSTKEMPEKMSIGSLTTPYHGLDMHIASVSDLIPHCGNNDDARFGNLVDHEGSSYSATQTMTVADRGQSIEAQQQDALLRKVVWDAEALANPNIDADAEGEDDPEYGEKMSQQPIGVRLPDGTVIEMSVSDNGIEKSQVSYLGMIEDEPNTIKNTHIPVNADNIATQVVEPTPPDSPLTEPPPSPGNVTGSQLKDHEDSLMSTGIETQALRNIISQADAKEDLACLNGIQDLEMLDLETQQPSDGHLLDEIQSFVSQRTRSQDDQIMKPVSLETPAKNTSHRTSIAADNPDLVEDCDCGVNEDEDYGACQCEGACGRWLHVWCMGSATVSAEHRYDIHHALQISFCARPSPT
ncbi:DNA-binding protein [Ramaria rubella]|nr:DNA-binding protein [Ramaria rubella]